MMMMVHPITVMQLPAMPPGIDNEQYKQNGPADEQDHNPWLVLPEIPYEISQIPYHFRNLAHTGGITKNWSKKLFANKCCYFGRICEGCPVLLDS